MEKHEYAAGSPNWVDLGSPNPAESAAFYGALFGWDCIDLGPDAGGYQMLSLKGRTIAGLGPQQQPDIPPYWTVYISVENVDESAEKVTAAGGMVLAGPMDVMSAGRMAVCMDPEGAAFSIWQAGDHAGSGYMMEAGAPAWFELMSRSTDAAKTFYGAVFGWTGEGLDMGDFVYTQWTLGDTAIGGMMPMDHGFPAEVPPHWMVYFAVDDVDASAARVAELGGAVCVPPTDIMPGRFSVVNDPHGAMFTIMTFKPME